MQALRPFQAEAISALKLPQHVLCVAPTGSGKTLIYEETIRQSGYRTLLITPLVALARQQAKRLKDLGIKVIQSGAFQSTNHRHPDSSGRSETWILSPESLNNSNTLLTLKAWQPEFLVVDECHCLWEWGELFRPAFKKIPLLIEQLKIKRSLWLTATLPPAARLDLRQQMPHPWVELGEFDLPPQLRLRINRVPWSDRAETLGRTIATLPGAGIIFVSTRESTARVARLAAISGKKVVQYHAGMSREERILIESQVASQSAQVVVTTSAFGMGMDYSHLQWVVLWQAPASLLSLTQSIGRVGRSGSVGAEAVVLWDSEDFQLLEWCTGSSKKRRDDLEDLAEFLRAEGCRRSALHRYFNYDSTRQFCRHCEYCLNHGQNSSDIALS